MGERMQSEEAIRERIEQLRKRLDRERGLGRQITEWRITELTWVLGGFLYTHK